MDFKLVSNLITELFEKYNIKYAVMDGFALGLHGIQRFTRDIDILIDKQDMGKVHSHIEEKGYRRTYHTENVSHYSSDNPALGSLDFIHAFREISLSMLDRRKSAKLKDGEMYVLNLEDIIGLKVQGMVNDSGRIPQIRRILKTSSVNTEKLLTGNFLKNIFHFLTWRSILLD